jgi:hypothetical protein
MFEISRDITYIHNTDITHIFMVVASHILCDVSQELQKNEKKFLHSMENIRNRNLYV